MPEQITKYPEVTLKVLKGAGAVCGEGAPQKILTQCPADRFCSLPTGEICVYGINEIPQMTQITLQELGEVVYPKDQQAAEIPGAMWALGGIALAAVFLAGLILGRLWNRLRVGAFQPRH
ncbi:MAG: hypothetical protein HYU47_13140 [Deltaproteobacteria bacterium]|nr:hypothetical protein [Deltaproteobacteria bacterium]MBI3061691.1 hypothetical protein [Deltaproteobacteria bacterium]